MSRKVPVGMLSGREAAPAASYSLQLRTSLPKAAEKGQPGPGTRISCYSPSREVSYPSQVDIESY